MKLKLGVMGSSGGAIAPELLEQAYVLGRAAAQRDLVVITGACPGLPLAAARGALRRREAAFPSVVWAARPAPASSPARRAVRPATAVAATGAGDRRGQPSDG